MHLKPQGIRNTKSRVPDLRHQSGAGAGHQIDGVAGAFRVYRDAFAQSGAHQYSLRRGVAGEHGRLYLQYYRALRIHPFKGRLKAFQTAFCCDAHVQLYPFEKIR